MVFDEVELEEVCLFFPEIRKVADAIAYDVQEEGGRRLALAVFIPSFFDHERATMYHFSIDFDSQMPGMIGDFFENCFEGLRERGYKKVYYKGIGDMISLSYTYDVLTEIGFETKTYLGELVSYRLADLSHTNYREKYDALLKDGFSPAFLDQDVTKEDRNIINQYAAEDGALKMAYYTPEYSSLCRMDNENVGVFAMLKAKDGLLLSSLHVVTHKKMMRRNLLHSLLGAIVMRAEDKLSKDMVFRFTFRDRFDSFETRRFFGKPGILTYYQEYIYQL